MNFIPQLQGTIDDLLEAARLEAGRVTAAPEKVVPQAVGH